MTNLLDMEKLVLKKTYILFKLFNRYLYAMEVLLQYFLKLFKLEYHFCPQLHIDRCQDHSIFVSYIMSNYAVPDYCIAWLRNWFFSYLWVSLISSTYSAQHDQATIVLVFPLQIWIFSWYFPLQIWVFLWLIFFIRDD